MHAEEDQESDVSSLDSNSDSLKSEDVFNGENKNEEDNLENDGMSGEFHMTIHLFVRLIPYHSRKHLAWTHRTS